MSEVVKKGIMNKLFSSFTRFCYSKYGLVILFFLVMMNHIGLIKAPIFADDYIQSAYFQTDEAYNTAALKSSGILADMPTGDFEFTIKNQFNFFDPAVGNDQSMLEYGALPWWTKEGALLHLFRPVASITHWIDYQLWPNSSALMFAHNLLVFLLGLVAIYHLYKSLGLSRPVAMFAILLIGLDLGTAQALGWIAGRNAFLVWALTALVVMSYHKGLNSKTWYVLALIFYVTALFTAEAAISIAGYLGAYMFTLDRRAWKHRLFYILPFAVMTVLWRIWYQSEGYGSLYIGQYIDPGRSLVDFISHGVTHYPILFWHLFAGTDGAEGLLNYNGSIYFSIFSAFSMALLIFYLLRISKHQAIVRFFLLASLFSLVPGLALSYSDPRVLLIPSIAGFALIGFFVREVCLHSKTLFTNRPIRWVANLILAFFLFIHIALSGIASITVNSVLLLDALPENNRHEVYADITNQKEYNLQDKRVVLLNAPDLFGLMYLPYYYAYSEIALPQSIRTLSSGLNTVSLTRVGENKLLVEPYGGFIFHNNDALHVQDKTEQVLPKVHAIYAWKKLMNFFHDGVHDMTLGQKFYFDELEIEVKGIEQGRPLAIEVTFDKSKQLTWMSWNWEKKRFEIFSLPSIGDNVMLKGFFESKVLTLN